MKIGLRSIASTACFLALLLPSVSHAGQEPPESARRYIDPIEGRSLDDLTALALSQEPSLQAGLLAATAARHEVAQAGLRANPAVSIERRREPDGMGQWSGIVEWPLELSRRDSRVATARAEATMAGATADERRRRLTFEVERQYGMLLAAVRNLALLDELASAAQQTVSLLAARVEAGAGPRVDRDAAAVDAGRLNAQRAGMTGRADAALFELKRLVGLPPTTSLTVRETLEQAVVRLAPVEDAGSGGAPLDAAISARPDVREAIAGSAVYAARAEQLRREGRFDLTLFGGYMRMETAFPQQAFGRDGRIEPISDVFHSVVAGAMLTVPLFDRNQGAVAAADARRMAADKTLEARRLQVSSEIASATARLASARASLAIYTGALRETARRNLDVMREAYQLGRNTVLDVLTEQRRLLELEMAYTDALSAAFDAQAELRTARGGEQR